MVQSFYDDYRSDVFYDTKKSYDALDDALDEYFNNLFDETELMDEVFDKAMTPITFERTVTEALEGL